MPQADGPKRGSAKRSQNHQRAKQVRADRREAQAPALSPGRSHQIGADVRAPIIRRKSRPAALLDQLDYKPKKAGVQGPGGKTVKRTRSLDAAIQQLQQHAIETLARNRGAGRLDSQEEQVDTLKSLGVLDGVGDIEKRIQAQQARTAAELAAQRRAADSDRLKKVFGKDYDISKAGTKTGGAAPDLGGLFNKTAAGEFVKTVGKEVYDNPVSTGEDIAKSLASTPAALYEVATHPAHGLDMIAKDYSHRYGDLAKGDYEGFRQRVKEEGAAGEVLDAAGLVGGGAAVTGRILQKAASAGKLGERLGEVANAERVVKVAGGVDKVRAPHPNLFKNIGAEALHTRRASKLAKRVDRGKADALEAAAYDEGAVVKGFKPARERAMKMVPARLQARANVDLKIRNRALEAQMHRDLHRGLSKKERRGYRYAIEFGIKTPKQARELLKKHLEEIHGYRDKEIASLEAEGSKHLPSYKGAEDKELVWLIQHADEVFTPELRAVADKHIGLAQSMAEVDPSVGSKRGRMRASMAQAYILDLEKELNPTKKESKAAQRGYEDALAKLEEAKLDFATAPTPEARATAGARVDALKAELDTHAKTLLKGETDAQYLARVAEAADNADLAPGGYFPHEREARGQNANFASGRGDTANAPARTTSGIWMRRGVASTHPSVLARGLLKNQKRAVNWNLVDDVARSTALKWSLNEGKGLTVSKAMEELRKRGLNPDNYVLHSPKRLRELRKVADEHHTRDVVDEDPTLQSAEASKALEGIDQHSEELKHDYRTDGGRFTDTKVLVYPKEVMSELHGGLSPDGKYGRRWDVAKGKVSRILLANPAWLQFQIGANALQAGIAGVGPGTYVKLRKFYAGLTPEERRAFDSAIGVHPFFDEQRRLGVTAQGSRLYNAWSALKDTELYRTVHKGNPFDLIFRGDNLNNTTFRRAVLYNRARRAAYKRMGEDASGLLRLQHHFLDRGSVDEVAKAILNDPVKLEEMAETVNRYMGDYMTFTHNERRYMQRYVMFYGFMRFAVRFTFATLPIEHPIMLAIGAQMGRMQYDELKDIFDGEPPPWEIGNYYSPDGSEKVAIKRMSPLFNAMDWVGGGADPLSTAMGSLPPFFTIAINQFAGKNVALDQPYTVDGKPSVPYNRKAIGKENRAQIALGEALRLSPYYRILEKSGLHIGPIDIKPLRGRQTSDSTLLRPEPMQFPGTTMDSYIRERQNEEQIQRENERGSELGIAHAFLPALGEDGQKAIDSAKRHREQDAKKKGKTKGPAEKLQELIDNSMKRAKVQVEYQITGGKDPNKAIDDALGVGG